MRLIVEYLRLRRLRDLFCQLVQYSVHLRVGGFGLADLAAGVHNSSMVAAAQMTANFFEAVLG